MDLDRQFTSRVPYPSSLVRRSQGRLERRDLERHAVTFDALRTIVERPWPEQPRVVSSAHGPLRHLLLFYPSYAEGELSYRTVYEDLFAQLPQSTELTILAAEAVVGDLEEALDAQRPDAVNRIVTAPPGRRFTVWAEDPYVVVEDLAEGSEGTYLVEPFVFPRSGDALAAELVGAATELEVVQSPLYFQGGNVVIGDDFVLLGRDYELETLEILTGESPYTSGNPFEVPDGADPRAFVRDQFEAMFGRGELHYVFSRFRVPQPQTRRITVQGRPVTEILYLGTGLVQPIFHIDMFISLAGRGEDGRYRVLVGSPDAAHALIGGDWIEHAMPEIFDDIAQQLERAGFDVRRTPMPLAPYDTDGSEFGLEGDVRAWYWATSNNCLVQVDEEAGDHVWLPTYGHEPYDWLTATDDAVKAVWEELGFTVHQLADFNPFAQYEGSVHCIKKYLAR